nr:hatching enzyme [Paracentrotus lividus]
MANSGLILLVMFMIHVTTVHNVPLPSTAPSIITQLSDITTSIIEEDAFGLTTPTTGLLTPVSENDSDDDGDDITTIQTTTSSSQTVISGVVVEEGVHESNVEILKAHLEKFGYTPPGSTFGEANLNYTSAILDFQEHGGINQTGILDADTAELLSTPLCGVPDVLPFVTSSITWSRNQPVTYSFGALTSDLNQNDAKDEIRRAFRVWDDVSGLSFREVPDTTSVDIRIKFGSYDHGDGISFDGRGGVLAHAFLPRNGDAHFDDSETWTIGTRSGTNLFQVAAHEFGHSLGLYHSTVRSALMYPYYQGYVPNFRLDSDDIAGIRSLYGSNSGSGTTTTTRRPTTTRATTTRRTTTTRATTTRATTTTTTSPSRPSPPRRACSGSFDAVVRDSSNRIYALTGPYFWQLDQPSPSWGLVSNRFGFGLPQNIDASFQRGVVTYFFSECYYYYQTSTQRNFPRIPVNRKWVGLPCNIDAVYRSSRGPTYFFKDSFVYKFNSNNRLQRRTRISSLFNDVPSALHDGVEAVVRADRNYIHFYRDGRYYRMTDYGRQFVNFPNGLAYSDVIESVIPQCRGRSLSYESEGCSNSSE